MSEYMTDNQSNPKSPKRNKILTRWGQLKTERASWWSHWKDLSENLLPRSGRYFVQDRNRGYKRHNSIYDNTGTRAVRVLAAGMMSGMTSPARPWFRLTTTDPDLVKYAPVKLWLDQVTKLMLDVFSRSNTYRAFHSMYEELGCFGTASNIILPDYDNVIHNFPLTVGEYCMAQDYRGNVDTLYREFQKTVEDVVREFGYNNCSTTVKNLYDRHSYDTWVTLIHAIEPRSVRDTRMKDNKNMAWGSYYFELGREGDNYLREGGFEKFPAICPRWAVSGGDIYGNSPGMEALGDIRQLQHEQLRKAQVIDYKTKPPLQVPVSMKGLDVETLPGGISFYDPAAGGQGIKTAFEVNLDLSHMLNDIQDVRERIRGAFYADLFLMLANGDNGQMTATEVAERHEEKLLMLGPVLERLHNEMLDPFVEMTFDRLLEAGALPEIPEELAGQNINVEFVSMLAQAQRAVGTNSIDRFVMNLGQVAQFKPEVLDKLDADKWADVYSDILGVDPELIVGGEQLAMIRDQRQQAADAQAKMAGMQQMAGAAKDLSQADMGGNNALNSVVNQFSGYTGA